MSDLSQRIAGLSPEQRALLEKRLGGAAPREREREPIAIVGLGCRFPGGADDADSFWRMLREGVDAITKVPLERWDADALFDADPTSAGTISSRWGGFIAGADRFDASFFGISPREAVEMDPQQRILLEVACDALDNAGQTREGLAGSAMGVFVGVHGHASDYLLLQNENLDGLDSFSGTGTAHNLLAGRLSYVFDVHGPAVVVDTACSSSLVAVHLAIQSLRLGESTLALVGGVNLILTPNFTIAASRMHMLAPDGRCKAFDQRADGFVRSEGCGVVVLKRLSDAVASGDPIVAVIRGSAINQDGHTNGITAPNGLAQRLVIERALTDAGVTADSMGFVEAHGTGTSLGDPIEIEALAAIVGRPRADGGRCFVGSVKTNIGHLEGAAGVAGLIKAALVVQRGEIPPNLHFTGLNPHIAAKGTRFAFPTAVEAWDVRNGPRRAGVSSFGWSGTNAHLILEQAPPAEPSPAAADGGPWVLPISAGSAEGLSRLAGRYRDRLAAADAADLRDLCFTAAVRRTHHEYRMAAVGRSAAELAKGIEAALAEEIPARAATSAPRVVFVFPGQGSQWLGMGRTLLQREQVFREAITRCDAAIRAEAGWSLLDELQASDGTSRLGEIDVVQPALFAVEVALAEMWRSWGIVPDAVVGHSMGEVAAAHVAGALCLADAVKVICRRSRRLREISGRGGMAVVELSTEEAQAALVGFEDRLSVAVSNGPRSTVIAGDPVALEQVIASLTVREVFCRPVKVDVASHSPQVDALRPVLLDDLAEVRPVAATVPIYSTVDAAVREGGAFGAQYWVRNLREPVRFFDALRELLADGYDAFIEMSPHPVLLSAVEDAIAANAPDAIALPSLRREEDEREGLFGSLARLYACGATARWKQLWPVAGTVIQLPGYPWQRERYWLERTLRGNRRSLPAGHDTVPGHPLLGQSVDLASAATRVWESVLELRRAPFAGDHRLRGAPVLAASAMVEMMLAASRLSSGSDAIELADVVFERDLFLRDGAEAAELQVHATSVRSTGEIGLAIFARSEQGWSKYACARARALTPMSPQPVMAPPPSGPPLDADAVYGDLARVGMEYGPHLRAITELRRGDGVAAATFVAPAGAGMDRCVVAPAILDACFQLAALARADFLEHETLEVPRSIDLVRCWRPGGVRSTAIARRTAGPAGSDVVDVMTGDEEGAASLELRGLRRRPFGAAATIGDPSSWLYEAAWEPMALVETEAPAGRWLLLANAGGASEAFGLALDAALRSAGATTRTIVLDGAVEDAIDRARAADGPWSGVIHCAGLDALPAPALTAAALSADPVPGADSLLAALRSLDGAAWGGAPRLWVITRGATVVSAPDRVALAIAQSPLWGLARVIETEHPSRFASVFDLDPSAALDRQAAQLADELGRNGEEPAVAMRGNVRFVQRLRPLAPTKTVRRVTCRRDATYLITGGLGGVGVAVASWLIAQGARRLVILGRTPILPRSGWRSLPRTDPSASRVREIQRLEALGAAVHYLAVNVADPAAVADALLHWREEEWPPIRGIIHSAADFDDRLLTDIDAPSLSKVFGPKAVGAWVLHEAIAEAEWFVLFSSLASLHPSPGHGSYAAANAFLDAFAQYLSGNAEQALSVSWGLWSDTGFSATAGGGLTKGRLAEQGIRGFSPADGLVAFETLLERNVSHAALFATDRRTFPMGIGGREVLPLLRGLGVTATAGGAAPVSGIKRAFVDEWRAADAPQRARLLEARIAHHISTVLKLADGRLDPQKPLGDYGLNSILGLELRQRLERDLELRLSATLIWNYPTVSALAAHLGARLDPGATPPAVPSERVAPRATTRALGGLLARVENLSDEAALAALRAPKARGTQ